MRCPLIVIVGADTRFQFVRTHQPVRFRHRLLAMDSLLLTESEPWGFAGQLADRDAHAERAPFALLIVLTQPAPHGEAAVPRGIIPDQ
jgi:hypothetical protein